MRRCANFDPVTGAKATDGAAGSVMAAIVRVALSLIRKISAADFCKKEWPVSNLEIKIN